MRVSVIIPAWNLVELTRACLRSLAAHSAGAALEVLVVDNGSTDATPEALPPLGRELFGAAFRLLRMEENLGFARACNAGARAASGEMLFFLNNDTLCTEGWLPPLLGAFKGRVGAVGPRLLYPDGRLQHCGITFSPFFRVGHLYESFPGDHPVINRPRPLQAITGAALMLPAQLFREAGGFFEGYRNGYEDMDLCLNLMAQGRKLAVAPESRIIHHTSATPGRFVHDTANGELLMRRHGKHLKPDLHLLGRLDGYAMRLDAGLSCWLELPEGPARELAAATAQADGDAVAEALTREPLWRGGWLRLMELREAEGRPHEALAAGMRGLRFFPAPELAARLQALTQPQGELAEFAKDAAAIAAGIAPPTDPARIAANRARLKAARREAYSRGDTALAEVLSGALSGQPRPESALIAGKPGGPECPPADA
ncbi:MULTISPECIES: glycosyltransferase family 2 protein [unclassified Desulfovibrio]|uniref:glycosyltransferase family 2 protein n=1 Tax=unclassified Desulfovibrio TaxID=2593640 RepID=UPI0013ECA672|nr:MULTISPECIES: glycosyltransferase family 2 protein [unclassified Desulfovibrio]